MGCFGSKDKLSKEDMDFLKSHTRYDEATIKEWYKGFKVCFQRTHALNIFNSASSYHPAVTGGILPNGVCKICILMAAIDSIVL